MKLSIMQPYFFPYLGYFSLIKATHEFIAFDTSQFIRHGWIERNRILNITGEALYIKVPLIKHKRETPIRDIHINNSLDWRGKIFAQLVHYKRKAPFYSETISLLSDALNIETDSIVELNVSILKKVCKYLGIDTMIKIWSNMNVPINQVNEPDEWALNICIALGVNKYYNLIGGKEFFNINKYYEKGIDIKFIELIPLEYQQFRNTFHPFLSIIDVLMFNEIEQVHKMIDNFKIV